MQLIRYANSSDAKALSLLAEITFRETFESTNTHENMELHCQTTYGEAIQLAEITSASMVTMVCEHEGKLIGYSQLRWSEPLDCFAAVNPGEIQRLYVAKPWHGQGIARQLMKVCLEEMEVRGFDVVWLGVWEHNPRAIAFYKKFGFAEAGDHIFPVGTDPQRDIIMVRPV